MIPAFYFAPFDSPGGPLNYFFGAGIGTNIGASVIWGFAAGFVGYLVARRLKAAWARLHAKVDALHARHDDHRDHLVALADRIEDLHRKVDG